MDISNVKEKSYKYDAFISYRHCEPDKAIAAKLHTMLETYKPPKVISKKTGINKINRVFRDREELPTSSNLSNDIQDALENSKCLIIICSTNTPKSQWVTKEIKTFMELHGTDNIMPLLIEGEPHDAFPAPLLNAKRLIKREDGSEIEEELEFMAADIRPEIMKRNIKIKYGFDTSKDKAYLSESLKELKVEKLRILSTMLNCEFNDLKQRQLERRVKKIVTLAAIISSIFILFGSFAMYQYSVIASQNNKLNEQNAIIDNKNKELEKSNEEIKKQILLTEKQRKIAVENEEEAKRQALIAAKNADEATKNLIIAKKNEQEAIKNLNEAKRQREIAIQQRNTAYRNQSLFLSNLSNEEVKKGNKYMGMMLALEALPKDLNNPEKPFVKNAESALKNALYSYQINYRMGNDFEYSSILKHEHANFFCVNKDEKRLYSFSSNTIELWNLENGALIAQKQVCKKIQERIQGVYEGDRYILANIFIYNSLNKSKGHFLIIDKKSNTLDTMKKIENISITMLSPKGRFAICKTISGKSFFININTGDIKEINMPKNILDDSTDSYSVDFSNDGSLLALYNSKNKKVYIYDIAKEILLASINENGARYLEFNSNNELFYINGAYVDNNTLIRVKNSKAEELISSRYIIKYEIIDSDNILACYQNDAMKTTIKKINISNKNMTLTETIDDYVDTIALSPDKSYFALTGDGSGTFHLFKTNTLKKIADINQSRDHDYLKDFCKVFFSPDSRFLIALSEYEEMTLWSTETGAYISTIPNINPKAIMDTKILKNGKIIFIDYNKGIYVINMISPDKVKYFYNDFPMTEAFFNFNNDDKIIVYNFRQLDIYNLKTNEFAGRNYEIQFAKSSFNYKKDISLLINSNDKPYLVVGDKVTNINWNFGDVVNSNISSGGNNFMISGKKDIVIYDRNSKVTNHIKLKDKNTNICGAYYIDSDKTILVHTPDKILYYNASTSRLIAEYNPNSFNTEYFIINDIKVSPDEKHFVCLYGNGMAQVYESSTRKICSTLEVDDIELISMSNNNVIAARSESKLSIFDFKTGNKLFDLSTYIDNDIINSCCLNSDGTKALAAYRKSGWVFVWDLFSDTNNLVEYSKTILKGRTLTEEERKAYFLSE